MHGYARRFNSAANVFGSDLLRLYRITANPDFRPNRAAIIARVILAGGLVMKCRSNEVVVDKIIAACDGNVRGALEVLLLLNENLETQIHQLYAALSSSEHSSIARVRH